MRIFKAKRIARNMRGLHNYVNNAVMRLLRFLTILFTLLHWTGAPPQMTHLPIPRRSLPLTLEPGVGARSVHLGVYSRDAVETRVRRRAFQER